MTWNELSAEGELIRAQRMQYMVNAGVPLEVVLKMVGMGTWVDEVKTAAVAAAKANKANKTSVRQPAKPADKNAARAPVKKK